MFPNALTSRMAFVTSSRCRNFLIFASPDGLEIGFRLGPTDGLELGFSLGPPDDLKLGLRLGCPDGWELGFSLGGAV